MTYQVATKAVTQEMRVWIAFLDFLIQGGDLQLQPRVFIVLIYPALFDQMLRAAMVVLNQFFPKGRVAMVFLKYTAARERDNHPKRHGAIINLNDMNRTSKM